MSCITYEYLSKWPSVHEGIRGTLRGWPGSIQHPSPPPLYTSLRTFTLRPDSGLSLLLQRRGFIVLLRLPRICIPTTPWWCEVHVTSCICLLCGLLGVKLLNNHLTVMSSENVLSSRKFKGNILST